MKKLFYILSALFLFSAPAFADVVWPSLYIVGGMMSAKVIIAGLLIEFWFVKFFTKTTISPTKFTSKYHKFFTKYRNIIKSR